MGVSTISGIEDQDTDDVLTPDNWAPVGIPVQLRGTEYAEIPLWSDQLIFMEVEELVLVGISPDLAQRIEKWGRTWERAYRRNRAAVDREGLAIVEELNKQLGHRNPFVYRPESGRVLDWWPPSGATIELHRDGSGPYPLSYFGPLFSRPEQLEELGLSSEIVRRIKQWASSAKVADSEDDDALDREGHAIVDELNRELGRRYTFVYGALVERQAAADACAADFTDGRADWRAYPPEKLS